MALEFEDLTMSSYLQQRKQHGCSFPDPVYGHAHLGPLAMEFLDSSAVQRLRHLKQLGCAFYAFPTAEHSRFVHSVGVGHLAAQCALNLRNTGLNVRPADVELLEVAGLCHDLGHGPFSHVFEGEFLPAVLGQHTWTHEAMSAHLLQHIVDECSIDLDQQQIRRVQDMISNDGKLQQQVLWTSDDAWQLQIVANAMNGIDVDKMDYLQRDAFMTGVNYSFDFTPLLLGECRVINGTICFPANRQTAVANLFAARATMHQDVYQNRKSKAAEYMIVDALKLADPVLGISNKIRSPEEFISLDDSLIREILRAAQQDYSQPQLQQAAAILRRLQRRDLYEFAAEAVVPYEALKEYVDVTVSDVVSCQDHNCGVMLQQDDVIVQNMKIDHCKDVRDPLKFVYLYNSDGSTRVAADGRLHRPAAFMIRQVRVFLRKHCTDPTEKQQYVRAAQLAFTRAMQQRFGQDVELHYGLMSKRSSYKTNKQQMKQQCRNAVSQAQSQQQQQQLTHAGSSHSTSSMFIHQTTMQDAAPLQYQPVQQGIVQGWSSSEQQQQQGVALLAVTTAAAALSAGDDLIPGDFVPATDDEDDYQVDEDFVGHDEMAATQFSSALGTAAAATPAPMMQ